MLCKEVIEQHNTFDDLISNFEQSHHVNNHKNNRCTLGEMLMYYIKNQDDILDYKVRKLQSEDANNVTTSHMSLPQDPMHCSIPQLIQQKLKNTK
jgi:hypothetical protein